ALAREPTHGLGRSCPGSGEGRDPVLRMTPPISVTEVATRRDLRRFLEVPDLVYRDHPNGLAPLRHEVRKVLARRRNPFFDHGEACYWLAWRAGKPVGRISAQVNRLHLETHGDATGHFGFFEA